MWLLVLKHVFKREQDRTADFKVGQNRRFYKTEETAIKVVSLDKSVLA